MKSAAGCRGLGVREGGSGSLLEGEVISLMIKDLAAAARLFDVANSDDAVIDAVEQLLDTLQQARRAKRELASLPPADLRRILLYRAHRGADS